MKERALLKMLQHGGHVVGFAVRGRMDRTEFAQLVRDTTGWAAHFSMVEQRCYRIGLKPGTHDGEYWHVPSDPGYGAAPYTVVEVPEHE